MAKCEGKNVKRSLSEIAKDRKNGLPLRENDRRTALFWFGGPSLYFPSEGETDTALEALAWLYRHAGEEREACVQAFSQEFSLPKDTARRLAGEYFQKGGSAGPVILGIEGLDGSGKTVQAGMLAEALKKQGRRVRVVDFPQYSGFFGREIGRFLSGDQDVSAAEVDEKSMCLWYAVDRWKTVGGLQMEDWDYIIFNRYTLSNVVYQSARKFGGFDRGFANWIFDLEHMQLRLPVPDLYLYLNTRTEFCGGNVLKKGKRGYVEGLDVYEQSQELLNVCHGIYQQMASEIGEISFIECVGEDGAFRKAEEVHAAILECLEKRGFSPAAGTR